MKTGDIMFCTFDPKGYVTILSPHSFDEMFWHILWNGQVCLMHKDHLEIV